MKGPGRETSAGMLSIQGWLAGLWVKWKNSVLRTGGGLLRIIPECLNFFVCVLILGEFHTCVLVIFTLSPLEKSSYSVVLGVFADHIHLRLHLSAGICVPPRLGVFEPEQAELTEGFRQGPFFVCMCVCRGLCCGGGVDVCMLLDPFRPGLT